MSIKRLNKETVTAFSIRARCFASKTTHTSLLLRGLIPLESQYRVVTFSERQFVTAVDTNSKCCCRFAKERSAYVLSYRDQKHHQRIQSP